MMGREVIHEVICVDGWNQPVTIQVAELGSDPTGYATLGRWPRQLRLAIQGS